MTETEFLVPSYYKDFRCKGGDCRNCCCDGWAVTVSMKEYFTFLGLECSAQLKKKVDVAFHLLRDADPDRYAQILPSFTGRCPMQREDGLCALQCECGEEALPAVCRQYPRSFHFLPSPEACISCSCERVIEQLISSDEITFERISIAGSFDKKIDFPMPDSAQRFRKRCMDIVKDDTLSLIGRVKEIYRFLSGKDAEQVTVGEGLMDFYSDSPSIGEECKEAKNSPIADVESCVHEKFPQIEKWMEKILLNHFYFMKFPCVEKNFSPEDAGLSLLGLYDLWLKLLANNAVKRTEDFIDVTGKLFRVAEHSRFYKNAAIIIRGM